MAGVHPVNVSEVSVNIFPAFVLLHSTDCEIVGLVQILSIKWVKYYAVNGVFSCAVNKRFLEKSLCSDYRAVAWSLGRVGASCMSATRY